MPEDDTPEKIQIKDNVKFKIPEKYKWDIKEQKENAIIINKYQLHSKEPKDFLRCMYTLQPISTYPIGIPIAKQDNIYYCIDVFETFNDALAELIYRVRQDPNRYEHSETLLHEIFSVYYPGHKLKPSADKRLLKIFNGDMDIDEFREFSYKIDKIEERIRLIPVENTLTYVLQEE